jgi:hypothetical protein
MTQLEWATVASLATAAGTLVLAPAPPDLTPDAPFFFTEPCRRPAGFPSAAG